jgi:hypothetical protein
MPLAAAFDYTSAQFITAHDALISTSTRTAPGSVATEPTFSA